jgi:hypothetical protein
MTAAAASASSVSLFSSLPLLLIVMDCVKMFKGSQF